MSQIARRHGPNKAAVAVFHSLIDAIWHLLNTGQTFSDLLVGQREYLGYTVTLAAAS